MRVILRKIVILPILFYQKTISPDHGLLKHMNPDGYCRYYPSCSEYTKHAILKKGILAGIFLGSWRILRCNPWSRGGIDEVK